MPLDQTNYQPDDSLLKTLIAAEALIADASHWITGALKVGHGDESRPFQWCALGAIYEVTGCYTRGSDYQADAKAQQAIEYVGRFAKVHCGHPSAGHRIAMHNNTLGHDATMAMLREAVGARRAELIAVSA